VVFWSLADNLVAGVSGGVFLHDRSTGTTLWIADGFAPTISPDGRWIGYLAIPGDVSSGDGGFYATLYDRQTNEATVIGVYAREIHGRPSNAISFSNDAEWLAFASTLAYPANPASGEGEWGQQIFVRDSSIGALAPISISPDGLSGNSSSASAHVSSDGRWVAFQSFADNLVPEDTNGFMDIFVWDRELGTIELVSVATGP
jgi:Tol biopolymer transport system component